MRSKNIKNIIIVFACLLVSITGSQCKNAEDKEVNKINSIIMTVLGPIEPNSLGKTLPHEHVLVDFIGADQASPARYDSNEVIAIMLPYLQDLKNRGFTGFVDCSPAFLARDVNILKRLSEITGLHIITNTGYYGAANDKYIPGYAFEKTVDELATIWTDEWENGIEGTGIYPGFIKIGVDVGGLSDIDKKLVQAAAKTHLKTGLTIACHTGKTQASLEVLKTIQEGGVDASALIIVHAGGIEPNARIKIAEAGAWVELDSVNEGTIAENIQMIKELAQAGLLDKILISHDAGWYNVGEIKGGQLEGKIKSFTIIADRLIPALKQAGFSEVQINKLIVENPSRAYMVKKANLCTMSELRKQCAAKNL